MIKQEESRVAIVTGGAGGLGGVAGEQLGKDLANWWSDSEVLENQNNLCINIWDGNHD